MKLIVEKVISKILGKQYSIDKNFDMLSLIVLLFDKVFMIIRGLRYKLFLRKKGKLLFIDKKVKLKHCHLISFNGNATIKQNCVIDALSKYGIEIGNNFTLGENCIIECTGVIRNLGEKLIIGNDVGISANSFLGVRGSVSIGDNTIIGPNFYLHSENHVFNCTNILIKDQGESRIGISIGENCWIGSNVTVLDGVKIGSGCVIAAGSVVTKNVEDNSVVAGVPAKIIKKRR